MANILTTIETDAEAAWGVIKLVWQTATGEIETVVEDDAKALLTDLSAFGSKLLPDEWAIVKQYAAPILTDAFTGDFADAETALINALEAAGHTFMSDLGSPMIQALLAMIKAL